ncbi:MAG TPA: hypothetical protein VEK15_03255 [Vicinamibacteria bacterium]|nr:hypothetical protein [Vicinamibacteria bacterium]
MIRHDALGISLLLLFASRAGAQPSSTEPPPLPETIVLQAKPELISLHMDETSLHECFLEVGELGGITILFDEAYRDKRITVAWDETSFQDALERLTLMHRLFYKILDPRTVIIVPDNAQKHRQYDDMFLHTFTIRFTDIELIANMFRALAGIQRVQPNVEQRAVTVRATRDQILVAHGIVERNDRPAAELRVDVEVLEARLSADPPVAVPTLDAYHRFKSDTEATVLFTEALPSVAAGRIHVVLQGGAPVVVTSSPVEGGQSEEAQPEARSVGLDLTIVPEALEGSAVRMAVSLRATVPAGATFDAESFRTRAVETEVRVAPGERALLHGLADSRELEAVFPTVRRDDASRGTIVSISASVVREGELAGALPPMPAGTEERIRLHR